jgi:hypothetical protein
VKFRFTACLVAGLAATTGYAYFGPLPAPLILAHSLQIVTSGMPVDIYQNGKLVAPGQCKIRQDAFGARMERVDMEVHEGDWLAFHVVNRNLGGGFPPYFAVAVMVNASHSAFQSQTETWCVCDTPGKAPRFIASFGDPGDGRARRRTRPWAEGDQEMKRTVPDWHGESIWGNSNDEYLKVLMPTYPYY